MKRLLILSLTVNFLFVGPILIAVIAQPGPQCAICEQDDLPLKTCAVCQEDACINDHLMRSPDGPMCTRCSQAQGRRTIDDVATTAQAAIDHILTTPAERTQWRQIAALAQENIQLRRALYLVANAKGLQDYMNPEVVE
jgi:hypothetical protein